MPSPVRSSRASDTARTARGRPTAAIVFGLILLAAAIGWASLGRWCLFAPDSFTYLDMARTLWETGRLPPRRLVAPPGFALLLAPLMRGGDLPLLPLRSILLAAWAAVAVLTFLLHRRELGQVQAAAAGLLVALSPVLFTLTLTPLSEMVFLVLATLTLLLLERWREPGRISSVAAAAGGLLAATACLTRSMGVVLLPLGAMVLLAKRDNPRRLRVQIALLFLAAAVLPVLAWAQRERSFPSQAGYPRVWTAALGHEETDAAGLTLQWQRLARYGPLRLESLKESLLPRDLCWRAYQPPWAGITTALLGGGLAAIALWRAVRTRRPSDIFVVLTLLMVALWPWDEGPRLIAPVMTVTAAYPVWIAARIGRYGRRRGTQALAATALVGVILLQAAGLKLLLDRLPSQREKAAARVAEMERIARWLTAEMPESGRWCAYLPDRHAAKLPLIGAAYLARRPLTPVDVRHPLEALPDPEAADCVWWHESLTPRADVLRNYRACETRDGFRVYRPISPGSH